MEKQILSVVLFMLAMIGFSNNVAGQCTDVFVPSQEEVSKGFRSEIKKEDTEAEKKRKQEEGQRIYTNVLARIKSPTRFKLSLDNDMTSGFSKTNDYVVFSVMENVYGTAEFKDKKINPVTKLEEEVTIKKRCVIIPKDTKVYGTVAHSNSRYPFSIGGRAKLFVMVTRIKIDDGTEQGLQIRIQFAEPLRLDGDPEPPKGVIKQCKNFKNRQCIVGRREKLTFAPAIVGAGTSAAYLAVDGDDSTTVTIAALTFLESLSKVTGIDNLVNPPNATLKSKMIFDVVTQDIDESRPLEVWVSAAPPEKPKEEKSKDEK